MRSFSQSQLAAAYRCNQYYKYLYVDKLESEVPKSGDVRFGTAIHMALDTLFTGEGDFINDFKLFWDLEKEKENRYGRYKHDELHDQGITLLTRFERLHKKKIKLFQMEQRLFGNFKDLSFEGTPDILGFYDDIPSVIDFKTSGSKYPKEKARFSEQMYLYAWLSGMNNFPVYQLVYIVFVKGKEPSIQTVKYQFTREDLDQAVENVYNQAIDLQFKEKRNGFTQNRASCMMGEIKCDFYNKCFK